MLEHSLKVAHIVGSIIARRTAKQVERAGSIEIDLSDEVLPAHHRHSLGGLMPQYLDQVDPTDTFVIITPEYNREYPASLRQAIDLGADEWSAKPAGFVSYGGVAGGSRVVEHLRQVFPEFHAATLRDTVTLTKCYDNPDRDRSSRPHGCDLAVSRMMRQMIWWGRTLGEAWAAPMQETTV